MGPDVEFIVVFCTVPSEELGGRIAAQLVKSRLAACVSRFKVKSTYAWEGKINNDDEEQLVIKTTRGAFEKLRDKIVEMHEYDVPEIIALPIEAGYQPYLNWIAESVGEEDHGNV
jgi:uncharacterized protein involved in tolerance to divalent cations